MKNIHVLPTSKPSRLAKLGMSDNLQLFDNLISFKTFEKSPQNIYITSDKEIKVGDWFIDDKYKQPMKYFGEGSLLISSKKIILTTDQDLIEDGVQSIPDEFLEWFVKNPSCDEVEVVLEIGSLRWSNSKNNYKIIIPKEEPKPHILSCCRSIEECYCEKYSKQETLEEFISEVTKNFKDEMSIKFTSGGIKLGAKWQQEQYEKDMFDCWKASHTGGLTDESLRVHFNQWFEQFKKK